MTVREADIIGSLCLGWGTSKGKWVTQSVLGVWWRFRGEPARRAAEAQQTGSEDRSDTSISRNRAVLVQQRGHLRGVGGELFIKTADVGNELLRRCGDEIRAAHWWR
jgi:hypothetical protein